MGAGNSPHLFFLVGLILPWCVVNGGEKVWLEEEFLSFDTSLWKVDRPDSFQAENGLLNIGRVIDTSGADVYSSPSARLTSFDYYRYGTLETKVRFVTRDFRNRYYYFGFFNREVWGQSHCWIVNNEDTLLFRSKRKEGAPATVASFPGVVPGRWYQVKIVWRPEKVECLVDGKSIGSLTDKAAIPDDFLPAIFDIYASDGGQIGLQVDYLKISGGERIFSSRPTTQVVLPKNSDLYPVPLPLARRRSTVRFSKTQAGEEALLENTYYAVSLPLSKGITISSLWNRAAGVNCLHSSESRLFILKANGKTLASSDFLLRKKEVRKPLGSRRELYLLLESFQPKMEVGLTVTTDETPNIRLGMEIKNTGSERLTVMPFFPLLENLQIGPIEDNLYFYPHQAGWAGGAPFDLREEYGMHVWMQVMSLFNPKQAGGVSTWVEDNTGELKVFTLRKVEKDNYKPISFNSVYLKQLDPQELLSGLSAGITMAVTQMEKELAPGQRLALPTVVVALHPGDWRYALEQYRRWARTWYRHINSPEWLNRYFNNISVHDRLGNYGFEKGFYSEPERRYIASQSLRPDREDHLMEWSLWWNYCRDPNVPWSHALKKGWMGDYYYPEDRGGLKAIKEEIERCQEKGSRVRLYMEITQLWKDTDIGKAHGKEWARMDAPGVYNRDYCVEPDDGWIVCPYVEGWQDYVAHRFAQIIKETGADGVRLDRGALMYPCFNAEHQHYNGTLASAVPATRWANLLQKVVAAVRRENPEACVYTEHAASDYLSQFHDGSTAQQFEWRYPEYEDKKALNLYDLVFFRFLFPEFKLYNWGQTFEDGARTAFFNAVCFERSELANDDQVYYLARTGKVLRESGDVFATLSPVPLVPTKIDYLYANKFPLREKVIYTLYNKNDYVVEKDLLSVPHRQGTHYVELAYDEEIPYRTIKGEALLSCRLAPMEVKAIAQFPKILDLKQEGDKLTIRLRKRVRSPRVEVYFGSDTGKGITSGKALPLQQGRATADLNGYPQGTKVIVKLFSGHYLEDEVILVVN